MPYSVTLKAGSLNVSCLAALTLATIVIHQSSAASSEEATKAVTVTNTSEPVLCAEKDNVTLTFSDAHVRRFRIEAAHPVYLTSLQRDNWKADWTNCDFGPDPPRPANAPPPKPPQRVTLYEEPAQWLVGWRFEHFWRPATATVRIGDRREKGLHLLQLWQIRPNGGEEVVVLYPQDGYWRARPLGPKGRDLTAFGSSFLIGPVEIDGRPLVRLNDVTFDPKKREFILAFTAGGTAVVSFAEMNANRTALDVTFDKPIGGRPFAALRSMYVTEFNNDVARVAVRSPQSPGWQQSDIMTFKGGNVSDLWAGRTVPSHHNTSSPDMVFKAFR
ncbi:MAG: hypothetical protein ACR2PA_15975 [Hyphomicrobiaceae bacterium]